MEDSQTKVVDTEREGVIEEMLRDAENQKVELPSDLTRNPVLNRDDKEAPPTIVNKITSAGYVYVWDSRTYHKVPVLYYMLSQILRVKRDDGSYRWTRNDPGKLPKRGTYKCLLHKDSPNRGHYDDLGFRTCLKDNITNPYQVTQHMKSKHKAEWAAIEEEKRLAERAEDRELQRALIGKVISHDTTASADEVVTTIGENAVANTTTAPKKRRKKRIVKTSK